MAKFRVTVTDTNTYCIDVDADNEADNEEEAEERAREFYCNVPPSDLEKATSRHKVHLGQRRGGERFRQSGARCAGFAKAFVPSKRRTIMQRSSTLPAIVTLLTVVFAAAMAILTPASAQTAHPEAHNTAPPAAAAQQLNQLKQLAAQHAAAIAAGQQSPVVTPIGKGVQR